MKETIASLQAEVLLIKQRQTASENIKINDQKQLEKDVNSY